MNNSLDKRIFVLMNELGVPCHLLGRKYIERAVQLVLECPDKTNGITKVLYPEIAKEFDTTWSRVERAIRHAVEYAFDHVDTDAVERVFGNCANPRSGKVSNAAFIAGVATYIRLED